MRYYTLLCQFGAKRQGGYNNSVNCYESSVETLVLTNLKLNLNNLYILKDLRNRDLI